MLWYKNYISIKLLIKKERKGKSREGNPRQSTGISRELQVKGKCR
jgi:hypothetical protein